MTELPFIFFPLLFIVAFLYASVGHGGASGYLALMALFSFSPLLMRPSALLLNVFVSLTAFVLYYRKVNFRWNLLVALSLFSVPAAFIGGMVALDQQLYRQLLGIFLMIPVIRFAGFAPKATTETNPIDLKVAALMGIAIGFFSGLIGIGGGIILAPLLLLLGWAGMKETATLSALFIALNSLAGLLGTAATGLSFAPELVYLVSIALAGGSLGAYLGANYFSGRLLKWVLALVLVIASFKLLLT